MFFKIGGLKNFVNYTGKHLRWSPFFKKLQAKGLQLYQKETPIQAFSCEVSEIFNKPFTMQKQSFTDVLQNRCS